MKRLFMMLGALVLFSGSASAQFDLGSILGKVKDAAKEVAGDTVDDILPEEVQELLGIAIPELEIPGKWSYLTVAVEFESADAITSAGGKIAAETVEEKLVPMLTKIGIKPGAFTFTFGKDGTLSTVLAKKEVKGKWSYDKESESITLTLAGKEFTTRMTDNGEHINILFKADKLLDLIKTVSSKSSNATLATIGAVVKSYDGMNIGFECEKIQ